MAQQPSTVPEGFIPDPPSTVPEGFIPDAPSSGPMNFAIVNGQRVPVDEPNSVGTFVRHAASQVNPVPLGQMIPFPQALGGAGMDAPAQVVKGFTQGQQQLMNEALDAYHRRDLITAGEKALAWMLNYPAPGLGTQLDKAGQELKAGKTAAGLGDTFGLTAATSLIPKVAPAVTQRLMGATARVVPPIAANPNAAEASAVEFGQQRGIPVDAGTATGNKAVQGVQFLADRSLAGSLTSTGRGERTAQALKRVGGELAERSLPTTRTPEQSGATIGESLQSKMQAHADLADSAYDRLRKLESEPTNQLDVPLKPAPVDALSPDQLLQVRRIVHELDAMPHTQRLLRRGKVGSSLEHVEGTGGEGATVYHDIIDRLTEGNPTRGAVQQAIEEYLAGGKENPYVKAAIQVAEERSKGRGGYTVAKPELPPSAGEVPTKLEAGRKKFETIGLPVDVGSIKPAIQPLVDQMRRQLPLTQQQANPGLHALQQILDGPDWVSLSQADRDLSAIKRLAREHGGLAKVAVTKLESAVTKAAANGSPEVAGYLRQGRQATIAKYQAEDVLNAVEGAKGEPVGNYRKMVAPGDSGIDLLRSVAKETPAAIPSVARALLDDLLRDATADGGFDRTGRLQARWQQVGPLTKKLLFPEAGQVADLDRFFLLAKKLNVNPNPSGTAYVGALGAQGYALAAEPIIGTLTQLGAGGLSALLHSKAGVKLLTQGLTLSLSKVPQSVKLAAQGRILALARDMGLPVTAAGSPATADSDTPAPAAGSR